MKTIPENLAAVEKALRFYAHPAAYQIGEGVMHCIGGYYMPSKKDQGETASHGLEALDSLRDQLAGEPVESVEERIARYEGMKKTIITHSDLTEAKKEHWLYQEGKHHGRNQVLDELIAQARKQQGGEHD